MARQGSFVLALSLGAALAAACSSGSGGSDSLPGTFTLALTDAASDELASFRVELESVVLVRAGGAPVGVLPAPQSVDLVTLESLSQVLGVVNVPVGAYTGATMTFDLTNAEAYLVGESTPATLLDGDGSPLPASLTLPVSLGGGFDAVAGRNRVLELDFDLDQSVRVDVPSNTVLLEPMVVLRVDRSDPKQLVVGGDLQHVDTATGLVRIQHQTLDGDPIGPLLVQVGPGSVLQIDGVPLQGTAGLAALASVPAGTWMQCYGLVDPNRPRILGAYLEAGTGTYNGGTDIVQGHIVGRTGGAGANAILQVLGHSDDASHTSFQFDTTFTVSTSFADTKVLHRGGLDALDTDALNVGQRVRVFGTLAGTNLDASAPTSVVRLQPTRLLGFATGAISAGTLEVDLVRVDLRDEGLFTWAEGGPTPPDPAFLQAAVGGLGAGLDIEAGTAVEVRGYFPAVDDAAEDFVATSLVNRDDAPSLVLLHDLPGGGLTLTPSVSSTAVDLALAGTAGLGEAAVVDRGFVGVTPLADTPTPSFTPAGGLGIYAIRDRDTGAASVHLHFPHFAQTLDAALGAGAVIRTFAAVGHHDAGTNETRVFLVGVVVD